jgi:hypothetical protein
MDRREALASRHRSVPMRDSFLFDASSLFFVVWSLTVTALALATFRRDLIPSKTASDKSRIGPPVRPALVRHLRSEQ